MKSVYICHNINTKTTMRYSLDPKDPNFPGLRENAEAKQNAKEEMREKILEVLESKRERLENEIREK